jgi:hypothetical protein
MVHLSIILLCITPLLFIGLLSVRSSGANSSWIEMLTQNAWSIVTLMSTCVLPFAGFLIKSKWDDISYEKANAEEYYYMSLLLLLLSLLLMGNTSIIVLLFLLMVASVYILKIKGGQALLLLKDKNTYGRLAGEIVILSIAVFIRFVIWRLSNT